MPRPWERGCRAALVLAGAPALVLAHAILTKASLEGGVAAGKATTVTLRFNAGIEPGFTRVQLVDARGEARTLEVAPGTGPDRVIVNVPPLEAGSYGLRYKVLAADGHVTESVLRFKVAPSD